MNVINTRVEDECTYQQHDTCMCNIKPWIGAALRSEFDSFTIRCLSFVSLNLIKGTRCFVESETLQSLNVLGGYRNVFELDLHEQIDLPSN